MLPVGRDVELAPVVLALTAREQLDRPAPYTVLGWQVPDIERTVRELTAVGVAFRRYEGLSQDDLGVWASPAGAKVAWFADPDGNTLSLTQF